MIRSLVWQFFASAALTLCTAAGPAVTTDLPRAAALGATASTPEVEPLAGAVERVLRAELDRLNVVNTAGTPALELAELQLAVGCVGETPSCLTSIAKQLEVELLLLTRLDRSGDETVMTVSMFDLRKPETVKSGVRRASGGRVDSMLLEQVDGLLRELFGLPPPPPKKVAEVEDDRPVPLPVIVVGGIGGVALLTGGVFGGMFLSAESNYASKSINTRADVDAAHQLREDANTRGTTAVTCFAIGGAALVAAAVLYFFPSKREEQTEDPTLAAGPFFTGPLARGVE
jgi:hypothetical protein